MLFYFHPGDLGLEYILLIFFLMIFVPLAAVFLVFLFIREIFGYYKKSEDKVKHKDFAALQNQNADN